jgi:hypothetical protein
MEAAMKFKVFIVSLFFFSSLFTGISLAQDKVVVIPLIETPHRSGGTGAQDRPDKMF